MYKPLLLSFSLTALGLITPQVTEAANFSPTPRGIVVETDKFQAEIVDGSLTGFLNKFSGEQYLRGETALAPILPHLPSGLGTQEGPGALEAARKLLIKGWGEFPTDLRLPNQRYPDSESRIEWKPSENGGTLRYTGLTDGKMRFPKDIYLLDIALDAVTGDLLLTPRAESSETGVYGVNLTVAPTSRDISVEAPIFDGMRITEDMAPALWRNKWPEFWDYAFVALNGSGKGAVGIWAEDAGFNYKDLFFMPVAGNGGIALSFGTMSVPPFEKLRKAEGVTWRVQAFDKNWMQAAARFRDWRARDVKFAPRADWTKNISFVNSGVAAQKQWLDILDAFFEGKDLDRTVTFAPVIRAAAFDTRHWDNSPYKGFKEEMPAWKQSGAKLMAYLQPMIVWGKPTAEELKDPEIQRIMAAHDDADTRSAFADPAGSKVPYVDQHHLGHKEWQEWFLGCVRLFIQENGADGIYHDQSYPAPVDSRGLVNGMTPPQGMADYFYKSAAENPGSIHGSEHMNEANSVGSSLGIASGILWGEAPNMRWQRIKHPSPVTNALHSPYGALFAFPHFSDIFTRGDAQNFHLGMDLQEGRAEVAGFALQNPNILMGKVVPFKEWMNEPKLDRERALLFVRHGLRPNFPVDAPATALSNFLGQNGEVFFYEKMPWGTRFVEMRKGKPFVHYGRAHGVTHAPGADQGGGNIAGWVFYNNDGPSGLKLDRYYVLDPDAQRPSVYFSPAFEVFPGAGITPSFYESGVEDGVADTTFAWMDVRPLPEVGGIVKGDKVYLHAPSAPVALWINGKEAKSIPVQVDGKTVYEIAFQTPSQIVVLLREPKEGFALESVRSSARLRTVSTTNLDIYQPDWNTERLIEGKLKDPGSDREFPSLRTPAGVFPGEAMQQLFLPLRAPAGQGGKLVLHFRDETGSPAKPGTALPEWTVDGQDFGRGINPLSVDFQPGQARVLRVASKNAFSLAWDWQPSPTGDKSGE